MKVKMVRQEWKNLFKNKILLISVIAITFIPILYSGIFDKSVWDPYGRAKDLPVAVVNLDEPVELMGQKINVGEQVVDNLKTNDSLDWQFVSAEEAQKGMEDLKYYMIITLPKDFSKDAASIIKDEPKQMEITYTTNGSLNYIAEEISEVGATELETQVREQVVKAYVQAIDTAGQKMLVALKSAASGSEQIYSGVGQLETGLTEYTTGVAQATSGSAKLSSGLNDLSSNVGPLKTGVSQLDAGANQLSTALAEINKATAPYDSHMSTITASLGTLSTGVQELSTALNNFESSLSPSAQAGLNQELQNLQNELQNITTNTSQLDDISSDAAKVSQDATAVKTTISGITTGLTTEKDNINNAIAATINGDLTLTPTQQADLIAATQAIVDNEIANIENKHATQINTISTDLTNVVNSASALSTKAANISQISGSLAASAGSINTAIGNIQTGVNSLKDAIAKVPTSAQSTSIQQELTKAQASINEISKLVPEALAGVNKLSTGSQSLSTGLDQLQGQIPTLVSGVNQLDTGATQLQSGLNELNGNSATLMEGIDKLESGAQELADGLESGLKETSTLKVTEKNIDQFAAPTNLKNDEYSKVSNYGEALAPYIMSLALFVGCMLFNFIYPIRKVSIEGQTSKGWWLSKISIGFGASSMMALIQATIMIVIGLPINNYFQFYLTAFISAWAYMSLIMFLAMTFDNPGRFVAMILLVLQLGGAGGTFPIQLQGKFYQVIHPYLPMSYSVYAFRNAISGGIGQPLFNKSILFLVCVMIVFVALLRVSMHILHKKHLENVSAVNDNQKLMALEDTK